MAHPLRSLRPALLTLAAGFLALSAQAPTEPQPAAPPQAELVVMNLSGPTLFASNQDLTDNGAPLASLPRLTYKRLPLAPGAHEFRFKGFPEGPRVATLQAESGRTYYLVAAYRPERSMAFLVFGDSMVIKVVPEEEGSTVLKTLKPSPQ